MSSFWQEFTRDELEFVPIKNLAHPLDLNREAWKFARGAKTERDYTKGGVIYIKVQYSYTYPQINGSDDLGKIASYTENILLLEADGSTFHQIPVPVSLNTKNIKEINRAIRFGRLDYMYSAGEALTGLGNSLAATVDQATLDVYLAAGYVHSAYNTPALYLDYRQNLLDLEADMESLFSHYQQEIYDYKDRGTEDFYDAVHAETDTAILAILNTDLPPDEVFTAGFTIIEAINYQLKGSLPV